MEEVVYLLLFDLWYPLFPPAVKVNCLRLSDAVFFPEEDLTSTVRGSSGFFWLAPLHGAVVPTRSS